jgi:RND family efflux transporter MFP subunit
MRHAPQDAQRTSTSNSAKAGPLLAALALLALAGCDERQEAAAPPPRSVLATVVHLEPASPARTLPGTIRARVESDLGFRVGGKVIRRLVDAGQVVRPGEALAELDSIDLHLQLQQARADLASAATARETAQRELDRQATLRRAGWSTSSDYDRQKTSADEAAGRYDRAAQAVALAARALDYGTLRADAAGVITSTGAEPGQVVAAGQTVLRLARLDEREATVAVPEALVDAARNSIAEVTLWALPGRRYRATLRELSPNADAATRTYPARFSLSDAPPEVMLGMTATVTLTADARPAAHVPMTAILDQGDGPSVWVVEPQTGALSQRKVGIAHLGQTEAVISDGLREGETIVTMGVQKLDAAQHVRIVSKLQS